MDDSTTYAKTGKGLLEARNRASTLSAELRALLTVVDGEASPSELLRKLAPVGERELVLQLRQLSDLGLIKPVPVASADATAQAALAPELDLNLDLSSLQPSDDAARRDELARQLLAELDLPAQPGAEQSSAGASAPTAGTREPSGAVELAPIDLSAFDIPAAGPPPAPSPLEAAAATAIGAPGARVAPDPARSASGAAFGLPKVERESAERAEVEARARAEAARLAREQAAREFQEQVVRRQQADEERAQREKEEQRQRAEDEERKARMGRIEAERIQREQALARRRAAQAEEDQKRAVKRVREEANRPAPKRQWLRVAIPVGVLVGLLAALHFLPFSFLAPSVERALAARLGEPVAVGELRVALFPALEMRLREVVIGPELDIRLASVRVDMDLRGFLDERKVVQSLQIEGATLPPEALPRVVAMLHRPEGQGSIEFQRIVLKSSHLSLTGWELPTLAGDFRLATDGSLASGQIGAADGSLQVTMTPRPQGLDLAVTGRKFTLPFGPAVTFDSLSARGSVTASGLRLAGVEGRLMEGSLKADLTVDWTSGWSARGEFGLDRASLAPLLQAFAGKPGSAGQLDIVGQYQLASARLQGLFEKPTVRATFAVREGRLDGVDLGGALQRARAEGVSGGATPFSLFGGQLEAELGQVNLRGLSLHAGPTQAEGRASLDARGRLSGRVSVTVTMPRPMQGSFDISGDPTTPTLTPGP